MVMKNNWLINILIVCCALCASCQDDFVSDAPLLQGDESGSAATKTYQLYTNDNSKLRLMSDGTWKATERVPLTGSGRVIGNLANGLLGVGGSTHYLGNVVDSDLTNVTRLSGVVKADALYGQLISVKDLYRTYSGGQKAGFVYCTSGSALNVNVLKQMTLTLYNDNELIKTFDVSEDGKLLGLDLINIKTADGEPQQVVSISVPEGMKFDEIALGVLGVDAQVISAIEVYYAFVGETPMRTTVKNNTAYPNAYQNASIYGGLSWSNMIASDHLLDSNPDNGPVMEVLGGLLNPLKGDERVTVNFGETIPANTEVGFVFSSGNILNLGLGATISLETYNPGSSKSIEEYKVGSVLGASLIGGGRGSNSFIATKPFQMIYLRILGLSVDLGVTQYHYAYTRAQTTEDVTSNFNHPSYVETHYSSHRVLSPEKGTLTVIPTKTQPGTIVVYNKEKQKITGMTQYGEYTFNLVYTYNGVTFTQKLTVNHTKEEFNTPASCNTLITKDANTAQLEMGAEGNLLCVICDNAKNPEALLDGSVNTSMVHYGGLQLGMGTHVVTVGGITNLDEATVQKKYRAGFIVEMNNEFLTLNALNYLYVELYQGGQQIVTKVSGSRPTIDLGLLNGNQGKLRIGVEVPAGKGAFDKIVLRYAGLLGLNLNNLRIYGVFYEPADLICAKNGASEVCMEPMSPANYNLQVDYEHTRMDAGVQLANGMYSVDNLIDGDNKTFVTLPMALDVLGGSRLSAKFNTLPAGQTIGLVLQNMGGVGDINVLDYLSFKVFKDEVKVDDTQSNQGLLDVSLISHEDQMFLEFTPEQEYNRIQLEVIKTIGALNQLQVFGLYTREDLDGDGIPDCNPKDEGSEEQPATPSKGTYHLCYNPNHPGSWDVKVTGGKKDDVYVLKIKKYASEDFTKVVEENVVEVIYDGSGLISISLKDLTKDQSPVGVYTVSFHRKDRESYYTSLLYVHPLQATWTGAGQKGSEHDWNHWLNWVEGAPWGCTDVVIPAGCTCYPILNAKKMNYCARIQFEAQADGRTGEVVNTHYLTYDEAWVDKALKGNRPYLLSAPLKATFTGDVFAAKDARYPVPGALGVGQAANYATSWPVYTKPADLEKDFRFTPQVYQHTFAGSIQNITTNGTEALRPGSANWTKAFNLVAQPYALGTSFLVRMGEDDAPIYRVRWPKGYPAYRYYEAGQQTELGREETIDRTDMNRFIYEDENGTFSFPLHLQRVNERPGDLFLFGNPFMAHLSLKQFFEANVSVGEVWLLRGSNDYVKVTRTSVTENDQVAPMEGFLVKLRSPYAERNRYRCYIHLVEEMLQQAVNQ